MDYVRIIWYDTIRIKQQEYIHISTRIFMILRYDDMKYEYDVSGQYML